MVISYILGGFGNQLGAFAWGYSVAKYLGQELVLDISDYTCKGYFRPYCLDKLNIGDRKKLEYPPNSIGFMEESCLPKKLRDKGLLFVDGQKIKTREELLEYVKGAENVYLSGYGGINYCTDEEKKELYEMFRLKKPSSAVESFKEMTRDEFSAAVHIRRTDFVSLSCNDSVDYFKAAITYVKEKHPDAKFYFFSDDIQYAKEQFGSCKNYRYMNLLGGMDIDLEEFYCFSACKCKILSNKSTYSAWACLLDQRDDKLEIRFSNDKTGSENEIYLNESDVKTLSARYRSEYEEPEIFDISEISRLVSEENNSEAVKSIDMIGMNSYSVSENEKRTLSMLKAKALTQIGGDSLPAALRLYYHRMQWDNELPEFHADYFKALHKAGKTAESAILAALAQRFGDTESYDGYFKRSGTLEYEIYHAVKDNEPKHFIFFPIEGWNNYETYVKTIAVLLVQMGQKATLFDGLGSAQADSSVSDDSLAEHAFNYKIALSSTYIFHIDSVPCMSRETNGENKNIFNALTGRAAARYDMPFAVVVSNPDVFKEPRLPDVKYIVPDLLDPHNLERYFIDDADSYIKYMASYADKCFVPDRVFQKMQKKFAGKLARVFYPRVTSDHVISDSEADFTYGYLYSDRMLEIAAKILGAANQ